MLSWCFFWALAWPQISTAFELTASGGGIVEPGADLVLTYVPDLDEDETTWDRCFWFWYDSKSEDRYYCSYDMDPETFEVTQHRCKPADFSKRIVYSGTPLNRDKCQVTVQQAKDIDNGTWAARLGDEVTSHEIEVTVASPIKGIDLFVNGSFALDKRSVVLGEKGNVTCKAHGGRPAPSISLTIDGFDFKSKLVDDVQVQIPGADGVYETKQIYVIKPTEEDNGKLISCQAAVLDGAKNKLFNKSITASRNLSVVFAPLKAAGSSKKAQEGDSVDVIINFKANPAPTSAKWVISQGEATNTSLVENDVAEEDEAEEAEEADTRVKKELPDQVAQQGENVLQELELGYKDSKYTVSDIVASNSSDDTFSVGLTVKQVTAEDATLSYRLVVANGVGETTYRFYLQVETQDGEVIGQVPEKQGEASNETSLVFGILAVICILAIVLSSIFLYRKRKANLETAPLSGMERSIAPSTTASV